MSDRPNEKWWFEHGAHWLDECSKRRAALPYYLLQEAFLSAYFSRCAPMRVLEFGCGFGRHLRYLREIPGLEAFGCDQSPTMLAGMEDWAEPAWRAQHIAINEPGKPLPYDDKSFDAVYTVSVLIHVHPDDLAGVLKELVRVCRGQILHVENASTQASVMTSDLHDGCWAHPLEAAYRGLGVPATAMEPFGTIQGVYRAVLNPAAPLPDMANFCQRLRAVDEACEGMLAKLREAHGHCERAKETILAQEKTILSQQEAILAHQKTIDHLKIQASRLAEQDSAFRQSMARILWENG